MEDVQSKNLSNILIFLNIYIFVTKINETNTFYHITNVTEKYLVSEICVNTIDLFIIWSEYSNYQYQSGYIYKSRYDRSNKINLVNESIYKPKAIVIDYTIKRIYWIDNFRELSSMDYLGNNKVQSRHK